jgi:hypothetical protein
MDQRQVSRHPVRVDAEAAQRSRLDQEQRHQGQHDHDPGNGPAEQVGKAAPALDPAAQELVVLIVVCHRHGIPSPPLRLAVAVCSPPGGDSLDDPGATCKWRGHVSPLAVHGHLILRGSAVASHLRMKTPVHARLAPNVTRVD